MSRSARGRGAAGQPRILLTTWRRQGCTFGPSLRDMHGAEVQYVQAVQRAGALALLVPQPPAGTDPAGLLGGVDGLLLIGGEDLHARTSGVDPATVGENASLERDRWEIALLQAALAADLPVLAVCRGMQLLNVALGGTLIGDIADSSPDHPAVADSHAEARGFRHRVRIEPASLVAGVVDAEVIETNSLHHQALDRIGAGLTVTGRAEDGIVEAVEIDRARWCVGIQWHPELMPGDAAQELLMKSFVAATAQVSSAPG